MVPSFSLQRSTQLVSLLSHSGVKAAPALVACPTHRLRGPVACRGGCGWVGEASLVNELLHVHAGSSPAVKTRQPHASCKPGKRQENASLRLLTAP